MSEENNQTPPEDTFKEGVDNVTIYTGEDEENDSGESTDNNQKQSEEGTAGEAKKTPEIDYKQKFSASSTEAIRLATELKILQSEREKDQGRFSALETEKAEMEKRFAEQDPEKYDSLKTKKDLSELREKLLLQE